MKLAILFRTMAVVAAWVGSCPTTVAGQDVWDTAAEDIRRLPSDSFPGLPEHVRKGIDDLGCLVPQGSDLGHPHNVLAGRFASPEQVDWVFLCSRDGASSIEVLWGGPSTCPTPLGRMEDRRFLQGLGEEKIGYSRRLMSADRDRMMRYREEWRGRPVPPIWHQGIEDYFEGKASTVFLCVSGVWIELGGLD